MLIYQALKNDHVKVKHLLEKLVGSVDAPKESKTKLIQQIRDELIPHSRAEEAVFYNSLRSIDGTSDSVMHGYAEHMEAETLLRTLQAMDVVNADWHPTARKLQQALIHHIAEEEGEIFAAAKQVLAVEEAEMMAVAFEKLKPEVREGGFMKSTGQLIINLMPQRFMEPITRFFSADIH